MHATLTWRRKRLVPQSLSRSAAMLALRPLAAPRPLSARAAVRGAAVAAARAPAKPCALRRGALVVRSDAAAAASSFAPLLLGIEDAFFGRRVLRAGASPRPAAASGTA